MANQTCSFAHVAALFGGVLGFLVRVAVSEEWRGVKEVGVPGDHHCIWAPIFLTSANYK